MTEVLTDYYRCPEGFGSFTLTGQLQGEPGYFRFGDGVVCFGQTAAGRLAHSPQNELFDASRFVSWNHAGVRLPFDPSEVVNNLRLERYLRPSRGEPAARALRSAYYLLRPALGVALRRQLQKAFLRRWERIPFPGWPVDTTVEQLLTELMLMALKSQGVSSVPFIWFWPEGASSCVMMTHDVETARGAAFCKPLMDIDSASGIRSSFQIVPENRYPVTRELLDSIRQRGFELNVQDLNHDGRLFSSRERFEARAAAINRHAKSFGARGFRAAVMYRNPDWYDALDVSFDLSIPNTAHLDPQRGGCCTVFPYFIGNILELPLTTVQDYSLFHILNDYSIELWKRQVTLIQQRHGLISFIVHPDYIISKRAQKAYLALLAYLNQLREKAKTWVALPGEIDRWWRNRSRMQLVKENGEWTIKGPGSERATLAYAALDGNRLTYILPGQLRPACLAYAPTGNELL